MPVGLARGQLYWEFSVSARATRCSGQRSLEGKGTSDYSYPGYFANLHSWSHLGAKPMIYKQIKNVFADCLKLAADFSD
jgi:hypothetical protein